MIRRAAIVPLALLLTSSACGGDPAPAPRTPGHPSTSLGGTLMTDIAGATKGDAGANATSAGATTFDDDLAFLRAHGEVIVLEHGASRVVLSPKYQGRVMTSAVAGNAASLGWIHRAFIESGNVGTAFDNYGGEDRFWLGPEGGQFALYFPPGAPFDFDKWQTPHAMQEGAWTVSAKTASSVTFTRPMRVINRAGTTFDLEVSRTIRLLGDEAASARFGASMPRDGDVKVVAYESENRITNTGKNGWTKESGLLSVWILAMFAPSADANVVIPFEASATGPIVNDAYFGKVPSERLKVESAAGYLVFACDGKERGKIGLSAARAKGVLASYSASAKLLTVVQTDPPRAGSEYVNSMWEVQKEPYAGDALNSYNDGPTAPGKPSLGGFYEIETSSPALALAPGASAVHAHRTFHFVGDRAALDAIGEKALHVAHITSLSPKR